MRAPPARLAGRQALRLPAINSSASIWFLRATDSMPFDSFSARQLLLASHASTRVSPHCEFLRPRFRLPRSVEQRCIVAANTRKR